MTGLLHAARPSLPAAWYYDPSQYRRELERIWYRDWVCVGRTDSLRQAGDFFTVTLGDQDLIVTLAADGSLGAFHNVCRHRGSILCTAPGGRFRNGRIICPYHTWTYGLDGRLLATPGRIDTDDFDAADFSLYPVRVASWKRFVFVNLDRDHGPDLETFLGDEATALANWPLDRMQSVHNEVIDIACNWKVFWENYSECYHCPRLHPELCRIMPAYRNAVINESDVPGWRPTFDGDEGRGRIAGSARTWTFDGHSGLPDLDGLTDAERRAGVAFMNVPGSMFIVGHPDYARSVRILPQGPERIRLIVDWLLPADAADVGPDSIEQITGLAMRVMRQDGAACELNQRGLHSRAFDHGVLVAQENGLWEFHEWLRERLGAADAG